MGGWQPSENIKGMIEQREISRRGWGHASGWKLKCGRAVKDEQQEQRRRGSQREGRERNMTKVHLVWHFLCPLCHQSTTLSHSFPHRSCHTNHSLVPCCLGSTMYPKRNLQLGNSHLDSLCPHMTWSAALHTQQHAQGLGRKRATGLLFS